MKRILSIVSTLIAFPLLAASAETNFTAANGAYDLTAPVVQDRTALGAAVAGQIVYDAGSSAFYGLPVGASPTTAANWVPLTPAPGTANVTSGGNERTERVAINSCSASPCTITSSTSGIASVTRAGTGQYTINFVSGTFAGAPVCTLSLDQTGNNFYLYAGTTTSAFSLVVKSVGPSTPADAGFLALCQGPR